MYLLGLSGNLTAFKLSALYFSSSWLTAMIYAYANINSYPKMTAWNCKCCPGGWLSEVTEIHDARYSVSGTSRSVTIYYTW